MLTDVIHSYKEKAENIIFSPNIVYEVYVLDPIKSLLLT